MPHAAGARTALRAGYDPAKPDAELLAMLTDLTLGAHDYAAAESLLDVGARQLPGAADWQAGRVAVYRGLGRDDSLAAALARRAARDADDVDGRLELARLAMKSKDAAAAARWAGEALQVDITNADAHAALGAALAASSKPAPAADAYGTAVAIAPDKLEWRFAEAQAFVAAGRKDRARATIDDLLARRADYPGARELRDSLGR